VFKKLALFCTVSLFISCEKEENQRFDTIQIDEKLHQRTLSFEVMDTKFESRLGKIDSLKKSSADAIKINLDDEFDLVSSLSDQFRSTAKLSNDTLFIDISNFNSLSGDGLYIKIFKDMFTTKPYHFVDVGPEQESHLTIEKQRLTLNKANFSVGDSILGKVYFRGYEVWSDNANKEIREKIYFTAYFRTLITK
jgi:hypothetical protein